MIPLYEEGDCIVVRSDDTNTEVKRKVIERKTGGGEYEYYIYVLDDKSEVAQANILRSCNDD